MNIPDYQIADFMSLLYKIQGRLIRKYGYKTVNGWREERLNRSKEWQIPTL